MDNARISTITNALRELPLRDYAQVLLVVSNRLAPHAPDAANYLDRAQTVCLEVLSGIETPSSVR